MKTLIGLLVALAVLSIAPARADFSFTSTGASTGFDFTCFSTKHCYASVNITSAGVEIFTVGNPANVTETNSASILTAVQGSIPAGTNAIGTVNPSTAANWGIGTSTQNSATVANGQLALGQFNTSPTTITTGNMSPLQMDNAGNLLVNIKAGAGAGGTSSVFNAAFPSAGTAMGLSNGTNMIPWTATTNYGTAPAAIPVPATNSFITNVNANVGNNGDAVAVGASAGSPVINYGYVFNGTTYDRIRSGSVLGSILTQTVGPYPNGSTVITASTVGSTAATTATLAGTSGKTTYICTASIRANATTAVTGNATITGTITGTLNYTQWTAPLASGLGVIEQLFTPCVPASATNTGIAVISAAPGAGGVVSVTATGYQL